MKNKLFIFIFLFLPLAAFAQNSLVPIQVEIGGQRYTFYTSKDVTAQIELREAKIERNTSRIDYFNLEKIRIIERKKLSLWDRFFDVEVQEKEKQVNNLKDENSRYRSEISQLNRVLRKLK